MDYINYNSTAQSKYLEIKAPYYNAIRPTAITFENENITATVDSLGHIEFYDREGSSLGFVDVPVSKDPSEYGHSAQYGTVKCIADGNTICFQLPIYGWEDNYPHCDGESDRWDRYTVRWFRVVFDCNTHQISVLEKYLKK